MTKHYKYRKNGLVFSWKGGAYIEISHEGEPPFDVYNVWDYANDEPIIEVSASALVKFIDDRFLEELEE